MTDKKWLVLIGIGLTSFLGCIDFTIVNTALPAIQANLHTTVTALQWIINIFILALSTFMVIMGRTADIYGRRRVLYIGMSVFGLASLAAGLATNIEWLIFFRLLQGIACAILYTATGAIVSNAFPEDERGKAIGLLFGINGIGLAIGPVLGGVIVSALSWRWVFLVNVPLILLSFAICFFCVKESSARENGTKLDYPGLILLMIGLPAFILAISQGSIWGWGSDLTLGLFIASLIAFVMFYCVEIRSDAPIIQFHLFANRLFISGVIATFTLAFFYCLAFFLMPIYLHNIQGDSGYLIGLMLLPTTAMLAILSPVAGRFVDKVGPKPLLLIGLLFLLLSAILQTQFVVIHSVYFVILAFGLMGIGWAFLLGPSTVAALSSVPEAQGAVAMGSAWTLHNVGGGIGLAVGTAVYHRHASALLQHKLPAVSKTLLQAIVDNPDNAINALQQHVQISLQQSTLLLQQFFLEGYSAAMWLLAGVSSIGMLGIFFIMKNKKTQLAHDSTMML